MDQATKLRERVQTNQEISNARVIAITSGKGGVGKRHCQSILRWSLRGAAKKWLYLTRTSDWQMSRSCLESAHNITYWI